MPIEYQQDMDISEYRVVRHTPLAFGKFSYRVLQGRPVADPQTGAVLCETPTSPPVRPEHNIPHFETHCGPRVDFPKGDPEYKPYHGMYAEVFLTDRQLDNIQHVRTYPFPLDRAEFKWIADDWYEPNHRPGDSYRQNVMLPKPPRSAQRRLRHRRNNDPHRHSDEP
jgi:hypothetical protein